MMTFPTIAAGTRANEAIGGYDNFVEYLNALASGVDTVTATAAGAALKANNLSDLTDAAAARTALGLGTAAVANTGTTAGTVAAGDDSRLTDARTPTDGSVSTVKIADGAVTDAKLATAKASATDLRLRLGLTRPQSGEYTAQPATGLGAWPSADTEFTAAPLFLRAGTLDRIGVEVTVAGGTGSQVRSAILTDNNGKPGNVVHQEVFDGTTPAVKEATISVVIPQDGVYWLTAGNQGGASPPATLRYSAPVPMPGLGGVAANASSIASTVGSTIRKHLLAGALTDGMAWATYSTYVNRVFVRYA